MTFEDIIAEGDKVVLLWSGTWEKANGEMGKGEGVDIKRVANGKIVEQCAFARLDGKNEGENDTDVYSI